MWIFGKRSQEDDRPKVVTFTSGQLAYAKEHGLRALCGLLMDRHSECRVCPFCGRHSEEDIEQVIVQVAMQTDAKSGEPILALYFSKGVLPPGIEQIDDVATEWAPRLSFAEEMPRRKAVVNLLDNGCYYAQWGPIANPTRGDYSTGMLDWDQSILTFYCDPEPGHTRWHYWESQITPGQQLVPEYRCLQLRGEWWIIDIDRDRNMVQQVATLTVADNPDHLGRMSRPGYVVVTTEPQ